MSVHPPAVSELQGINHVGIVIDQPNKTAVSSKPVAEQKSEVEVLPGLSAFNVFYLIARFAFMVFSFVTVSIGADLYLKHSYEALLNTSDGLKKDNYYFCTDLPVNGEATLTMDKMPGFFTLGVVTLMILFAIIWCVDVFQLYYAYKRYSSTSKVDQNLYDFPWYVTCGFLFLTLISSTVGFCWSFSNPSFKVKLGGESATCSPMASAEVVVGAGVLSMVGIVLLFIYHYGLDDERRNKLFDNYVWLAVMGVLTLVALMGVFLFENVGRVVYIYSLAGSIVQLGFKGLDGFSKMIHWMGSC